MSRIDLLTAQMRQRAVKRVSIQSGEKIQLFDAEGQLIGSGAALPSQTITEILSQIAPVPLDGVPVAFPYSGRDGEFEISVAPGGQGFDVQALSFAVAQNEPLQTQVVTQNQIVAAPGETAAPTPVAPVPVASEPAWYYSAGEEQKGPETTSQIKALVRSGGIRRGTYLWHEGLDEWQSVDQSEFKSLLPVLPNPKGDPENIWYYRSMTGQPVPVDRAVLVDKLKSGELTSDAWVWRDGMIDWATASESELASALTARPGLAPVGAPIPSPTGGGPRALPGGGPYNVYGGGDPDNTSGGGWDVDVPKGARGLFNVGAFLFPVFWCHSMGLPSWGTGILFLNIGSRYIPFVGLLKIPVCFGLGFMGNRIAWRNRRFDSVDDFRRCQFLWGVISAAVWGVFIAGAIGVGVWLGSQRSQMSNSFPTSAGQSSPFPSDGGEED